MKLVSHNNYTNLFTGHTTVKDYSLLLKTLKVYNFAFDEKNRAFPMKSNKLSFSSYPGALYSGDDFYLTNKQLCITQTKLTPFNFPLYKQALDEKDYIPDFIRIMTANYLADNAVTHFLIKRKNGRMAIEHLDPNFIQVSG